MRYLNLLLGASAAFILLAGCDQVRLPGNAPEPKAPLRAVPEAAPRSVAPPAAVEEPPVQSADTADLANAPEAGEPETLLAEADTTGTDEDGEAPGAEAGGDDPASDAEAGTDVQPAALAAMSLGQINAMRCALPEDAAPTPTVAMVAGATEIEDPVVGVEAVNALAARLSAFPGIVKLEPRRTEPTGATATGHCGALRISQNWFVTAAHCVDQPYDEIGLIGAAEDLRSPEARRVPAIGAVCHAGYKGTANGYANDIALIRLSDEQVAALEAVPAARFGETRLPLAPVNYPEAEMAGWGVTRFGGPLSSQLLATGLELTSAGPAAITVRSRNGAGPCIGDSGGPLFVTEADGTRTAIGILSVVEQNRTTGNFCEGEYSGRYISLQGYAGWISSVMSLCETDPAACR
ncbi:trypsin-like serine protease [Hyphomonas sp.]|uniref:S1 family peptidase n=1 Tax=Hyphomonas sp. TaxID=87 RepID=UPI00391A848E